MTQLGLVFSPNSQECYCTSMATSSWWIKFQLKIFKDMCTFLDLYYFLFLLNLCCIASVLVVLHQKILLIVYKGGIIINGDDKKRVAKLKAFLQTSFQTKALFGVFFFHHLSLNFRQLKYPNLHPFGTCFQLLVASI